MQMLDITLLWTCRPMTSLESSITDTDSDFLKNTDIPMPIPIISLALVKSLSVLLCQRMGKQTEDVLSAALH